MRAPTDMPRRQPRLPGRGRAFLVVGVVVLFLLLTSLRGIAGFYTDYLWFASLHRANVFRGVLGAKVALAVIFTGAFFALLWVNLVIADRLAPPFRPDRARRGVPRALPRPGRAPAPGGCAPACRCCWP